MKDIIKTYIIKQHMIEPGDRIVIGLSGGSDSVYLFRVLAQLSAEMQFEIIAVHVEHGIRGKDADADAEFAENLSLTYGVECIRFAYDIPQIAKKHGFTEEEAGRIKRYETFERVCKEKGANKIAVAHHADDNAETLLFNLVRGSGIRGMGGMRPINDNIIRPLLCVTKKQILQELGKMGQSYRTDQTNFDTAYSRNRIRNNIIPELLLVNEAAVSNINSAMEQIRGADSYIALQAASIAGKCLRYAQGATFISITSLLREHEFMQSCVVKIAIEEVCGLKKDITSAHVRMVMDLIYMENGKRCDLPYGVSAYKEYDEIRLAKAFTRNEDTEAKADMDGLIKGEVLRLNFDDRIYELMLDNSADTTEIKRQNPYTKFIDCDKIKNSLRVRHPQEGDYLVINDKGSQKKLTRYLIDEKIPKTLRNTMSVIADGSHVIWVVGMRISSYYMVSDETGNILRISILEDQNVREN